MISVIMLTYNRPQFVVHMIEDILGQSYTDFEYVIVDNGSSDETPQILNDYSQKDKRIKVVTIEAGSIGRGRNIGLKASQGEYIAYIDDDDRVEQDFLEFLYRLLIDNNADMSMCGTSEGDGITKVPQCIFDDKRVLTGEEATRLLIGRKYIRAGTAAKLYRREILERFPFVENYRNEDLHTQYKYLLASNKVVIHGIDKYYITRHAGNVSGFTSNESGWNARTIQDYLDAYHNRTEYIKDNAPVLYDLARYSEWSFMISMVEKINRLKLADCNEMDTKLKNELLANGDLFLQMPEIQEFEKEWMNEYVLN